MSFGNQTSFDKRLQAAAVRSFANQLVGYATDYQIAHIAFHKKKISKMVLNLDDLDEIDMESLADWMRMEVLITYLR